MQQRRVPRAKNPQFIIESIPPASKVQYFPRDQNRSIKIAFIKSKSSNHPSQQYKENKLFRSFSFDCWRCAVCSKKNNSVCISLIGILCVVHHIQCVRPVFYYHPIRLFWLRTVRDSTKNHRSFAFSCLCNSSLSQRIPALLRKTPAIR